MLAEQFEVENYGFEKGGDRVSLEEIIKGTEGVWEEIVRVNQLQPTKSDAVGVQWFVDVK